MPSLASGRRPPCPLSSLAPPCFRPPRPGPHFAADGMSGFPLPLPGRLTPALRVSGWRERGESHALTSEWPLGRPAHYLDDGALSRYSDVNEQAGEERTESRHAPSPLYWRPGAVLHSIPPAFVVLHRSVCL